MKISKLFHWLYAAVMMMPLFLFPIFSIAVRSDNNFQPIDLQVQEKVVVDFNQQVQDADFSSDLNINYWRNYNNVNTTIQFDNNSAIINFITDDSSNFAYGLLQNYINSQLNHYYIFDIQYKMSYSGLLRAEFNNDLIQTVDNTADTILHFQHKFQLTTLRADRRILIYPYNNIALNNTITFYSINLFDLTQMGLEDISVQDFNLMFPNSYYEYTQSQKMLVNKLTPTTYNDTDVGSQMVYTAYRVIDNYFNYDNVFNFKDLYTWLETTYFSGTAPMGFFIFWHLLIYWLLTSLLWLLFDVLMYVPMLIHRWLDKAALS